MGAADHLVTLVVGRGNDRRLLPFKEHPTGRWPQDVQTTTMSITRRHAERVQSSLTPCHGQGVRADMLPRQSFRTKLVQSARRVGMDLILALGVTPSLHRPWPQYRNGRSRRTQADPPPGGGARLAWASYLVRWFWKLQAGVRGPGETKLPCVGKISTALDRIVCTYLRTHEASEMASCEHNPWP